MDALLDYLNDPATPFAPADLVFGLYLLYGFIRGLFRGFPAELAGILGTAATLFLAWKYHAPISEFIRAHTRMESETGSDLLAYLLLVLTLLLVWKLITLLFRKTLDWTCPTQLRRWGGGLVGAAKGLLILAMALTAVDLSGHEPLRKPLVEESALGRATREFMPGILHRILPGVFPAPEDPPQPADPEPEASADGSGDA